MLVKQFGDDQWRLIVFQGFEYGFRMGMSNHADKN